ncbi:atherin-like [Chroicocephalus ridibundus]|uniref:atherin-like n=1 Tax=Chroicocephalus ridibundus TaxID=1192867 RepID=UPI002FDD75DF
MAAGQRRGQTPTRPALRVPAIPALPRVQRAAGGRAQSTPGVVVPRCPVGGSVTSAGVEHASRGPGARPGNRLRNSSPFLMRERKEEILLEKQRAAAPPAIPRQKCRNHEGPVSSEAAITAPLCPAPPLPPGRGA